MRLASAHTESELLRLPFSKLTKQELFPFDLAYMLGQQGLDHEAQQLFAANADKACLNARMAAEAPTPWRKIRDDAMKSMAERYCAGKKNLVQAGR